jgi:arginase family enzyme
MKVNSPQNSDLIFQKLSSDMGIHRNPRKGTLNAPEVLMENFEFEKKVLIEDVFPDEFDLEETHRRIKDNTEDLLQYEKPILSIGGDHSVSFPVIKALKQNYPDLKLVWLDSHLDVKEKVGEHVSHDVVVRQLLENGFEDDEIYLVGVTRTDEDEEKFLENHDLNIHSSEDIEKFLREFKPDEQPVYLSVDIDVLKQEIAPGTGYPDGELGLDEVKQVITSARPSFADLVEVAPPLDKQDKTVETGREIMKKLAEELQ